MNKIFELKHKSGPHGDACSTYDIIFLKENVKLYEFLEDIPSNEWGTIHLKVLNPIIDWTTEDVWEFIKEYKIPYCCLYDEGFTRLGCIGCPMGGRKGQLREFERYPKYKANYIRAFEKMLKYRHKRELDGIDKQNWKTGEDVFKWWLNGGDDKNETLDGLDP